MLSALFGRLDLWVQVYCVILGLAFLVFLGAMLGQFLRAYLGLSKAHRSLAPLAAAREEERRNGRELETVERLRETAGRLSGSGGAWWPAVDNALERYESPERKVGYFVTRPIDELVSLDDVSRGYAWSLYQAVPGILTSMGLLGTFIAILLGLDGLTMQNGTVEGLGKLIENLSGKFATSIVALGLSVIFLLIELLACQSGLRNVRNRLAHTLTSTLPYLSPSRLLLDIQRQSVKQSVALGNISTDVVDKFSAVFRDDLAGVFAQGISTSMASQLQSELGPTLTELTAAMGDLKTTVANLESQKQESVVGQLKGLTEALERSLRESLAEMGQQFRDALHGSTKDEFGALAEVVKGSAGMLEQMNSGFATMQSSLQSIVDEARTSTSAQMRSGMEQTERLNALVEGLMVRLNDTASQNYEQVTAVLTGVVTQLSERVTTLTEDLVQAVGSATTQSQTAASDTMKQAGDWSAQTSKQLTDLLHTLQSKSTEFDQAGQTLLAAQATLQATLDQNHKALQALGAAAGEVKAYSTSLSGLQRQVEEGQKTQNQLATMSRQSVEKLTEAAGRHEHFLAQYKSTFEQYEGVFEGLDQQIARILEAMLDRLQNYNRAVESNFKIIVDSANNVMPRMAGVIKSSTDDLKEHLDELTDVLEKGTRNLAAATGANGGAGASGNGRSGEPR